MTGLNVSAITARLRPVSPTDITHRGDLPRVQHTRTRKEIALDNASAAPTLCYPIKYHCLCLALSAFHTKTSHQDVAAPPCVAE
jgi:hypothetical protein